MMTWVLIEGDDLILIDIECIEQFFDIPAFGGHYFSGKCIPYNRYLLEEFHKVVELNISPPFRQDKPSKAGFLEVITFQYHFQVICVVLLRYEAVIVTIYEIEDPTNKRILSS